MLTIAQYQHRTGKEFALNFIYVSIRIDCINMSTHTVEVFSFFSSFEGKSKIFSDENRNKKNDPNRLKEKLIKKWRKKVPVAYYIVVHQLTIAYIWPALHDLFMRN